MTSPSRTTYSWNDQLAQKYYDNLFREFAVCDLKHYKSGNVTLLQILSQYTLTSYAYSLLFVGEPKAGFWSPLAGENTCANTHFITPTRIRGVQLSTLELPFAYGEHGEHKSALVRSCYVHDA